MGYNSTIVVYNDCLHDLGTDPSFGLNVSQGIMKLSSSKGEPIFIKGATIVETHHADSLHLISVGSNNGTDLGYSGDYDSTIENQLKVIADKYGYVLHKKSNNKGRKVHA